MINRVVLVGRITKDPELRKTQSGLSTVSFTVACNRRFSGQGQEQQADFINCVAWRGTAEFITRYFDKGSALCIIGNIQTRSWQDQNGGKRYATEVIADEASFVESKNSGQQNPNAPSFVPQEAPQFEELDPDDDLPF